VTILELLKRHTMSRNLRGCTSVDESGAVAFAHVALHWPYRRQPYLSSALQAFSVNVKERFTRKVHTGFPRKCSLRTFSALELCLLASLATLW
jgi:hypothetical protein